MAKSKRPTTKKSAARKAGAGRRAESTEAKRIEPRMDVTPDLRKVTRIQAQRLASLTNLKARDILGNTVADLSDKFKWRINPELFLFREICGRVVKRDPVTGELRPVPFATVHVLDADCSFLWFFPIESPWSWAFPIICNYEEIGTVTTDECGRFCVLVPRWDIDWILRWRIERRCAWDVFVKPTIRDLLDELRFPVEERPPRPGPWPEPDPPLLLRKTGGMLIRRAEELVGPEITRKLAAVETATTFGVSNNRTAQLLDAPAFPRPLPPPLTPERFELSKGDAPKDLARQLKVNLDRLDPNRFIGPFKRCWYEIFPEWSLIVDVPDITFRVTQDVDGDGVEETIYDEGYFDIRWNSGSIPDVTLEASQIAVSGLSCDVPDIPCEDTPVIVMAGFMPLQNLPGPADPYHDQGNGYARRPNRPRPSGIFTGATPGLALSPFCDDLHLRGCNRIAGAEYYRLRYSYNGGSVVPFTNLTWSQFRFDGVLHVLNVTPDSDGWYEILNPADGWMDPNLLLNFRTGLFQNGLYLVDLQLGDAAKNVIPISGNDATDPIGMMVDNSAPNVNFTVSWRRAGDLAWIPMEQICPVVTRSAGQTLEFRLVFVASATHLRSVALGAGGCGAGTPIMTSALPSNWQGIRGGVAIVPPDPVVPPNYNGMQHWHTDPVTDNSVSLTAFFELSGMAAQGVYSFSASAEGRTFNPAGGDSGDDLDWYYDPVYRWTPRYTPFAVVNE